MSAVMERRRELTITKLERDADGFWRARVTGHDGVTVDVDRRYGSWQAEVRIAPRSHKMVRRDVLAHVAIALQAKVRPLDRKEAAAGASDDADERTRANHRKEPDVPTTTAAPKSKPAARKGSSRKAEPKAASITGDKPATTEPAKPAKAPARKAQAKYPQNVRDAAKRTKEILGGGHAPGPKQHAEVRKALGSDDPLATAKLTEAELRAFAETGVLDKDKRAGLNELAAKVGDPWAKGRNLAAILVALVEEKKA